jgi:hypothetical protein
MKQALILRNLHKITLKNLSSEFQKFQSNIPSPFKKIYKYTSKPKIMPLTLGIPRLSRSNSEKSLEDLPLQVYP